MERVYERCCGLDVHKNLVVACLITPDAQRGPVKQIRTFRTITSDLLALGDWLRAAGCTHVAMESTGVYWKPVHNLLEDAFVLLVVNAQHIKAVPGRKTDVRDAEWIADLLQHGLLRGSFIPPTAQRELRDLTRYRTTVVAERARVVNRLQKTLEDTNLKLASVATNILGKSARAMLEALLAGETDPAVLANLALGRLRAKRQELQAALVGTLKPHHRFLIAEHLAQIDHLDEAIARVDVEIEAQMQADTDTEAVALLDSIPGISQRAAEGILAEIGTNMRRFKSAKHLASWAGMCPGNHQSAGKQLHGTTRKGSPWLRQLLLEAAHAAARTKTYLGAQYRRLAKRRGAKKALFAVAHSILVIAYHLLERKVSYHDLGANFFDERDRAALQKQLVRRLEHLGYEVALHPAPPAA
jgi:transposase